MGDELTLDRFAHELAFHGWSKRALVQLGLPGSDEVVLWCVPALGHSIDRLEITTDAGPLAASQILRACTASGKTIAARAVIPDLEPSTRYRVLVGLNEQEFVRCATTAPDRFDRRPFSFLAFSCFAPFSGKGSRALPSDVENVLLRLARVAGAPDTSRPAFALGMGDQVYVDHGASRSSPVSLLEGRDCENLRYTGPAEPFLDVLYRAHFSYPHFDRALRALPSAMMWDDHEIRDGWGSHGDEAQRLTREPRWLAHVAAARRWFIAYQALRNPMFDHPAGDSLERLIGLDPSSKTIGSELHFSFDWGELATFFVMDLRSQRSFEGVVDAQIAEIGDWLKQGTSERGRLFVLVSSIPLTLPIWHKCDPGKWLFSRDDDARDQWWSVPARAQATELRKLLAAHFAEHPRDRLLIMSGDVHYSEVRAIQLANGSVIGHEVVSSGLAQSFFHKVASGFRTLEDRRPRFVDDELRSTSLGRRYAPGFAQVFVDDQPEGPPRVGIVFHFGKQPRDSTRAVPRELFVRPHPVRSVDLVDCF